MRNFILNAKFKKKGVVVSVLFSILILFFALNGSFSCCAAVKEYENRFSSLADTSDTNDAENDGSQNTKLNEGNAQNKTGTTEESDKKKQYRTGNNDESEIPQQNENQEEVVTIQDTLPSCNIF